MRIIAIRVRPVCIAFSCLYAVVGLLSFIQFCFLREMQQFTFPFGVIVPFVYFSFNLHLPRPLTASAFVAYAIGAVIAWAISGCITGLVGTCSFNFIADSMGGVDARFVKTADDQLPPASGH